MATNNFKPFATAANANVTAQADWESLPALLSGFTAGKASSAQVNKAIRQATTIAALVGQFIANSGVDALDNADVNGLVTKFTNALTTNLGLGNILLAGVSTGLLGSNGYWRFPGVISGVKREIIVQFQRTTLTSGSYTDPNPLTVSFPIAYPTRCVGVWGMHDDTSAGVPIGLIAGYPVDTLTAKLRAVKLFAASGNGDTYKASVGQSVGSYLLSWGY